jgi:hypothetical protein
MSPAAEKSGPALTGGVRDRPIEADGGRDRQIGALVRQTGAGLSNHLFGDGWVMKKVLIITPACTVALGLVVALGVKHDRRNPNQHWDQYWAVRELDVWSVFGFEIYARDRLAVYDMTGRTTRNLPKPINAPSVQVRRFGTLVQGDQQLNLGEDNYQQDECIAYIRETLRGHGIKHKQEIDGPK